MKYIIAALLISAFLLLSIVTCQLPIEKSYEALSKDPNSPTQMVIDEEWQITFPLHAQAVYLSYHPDSFGSRITVVDTLRSDGASQATPFIQISVRPRYAPSDIEAGYTQSVSSDDATFLIPRPAITCPWIIKLNNTKEIEVTGAAESGSTDTISIKYEEVSNSDGLYLKLCENEKPDTEQPMNSGESSTVGSDASSGLFVDMIFISTVVAITTIWVRLLGNSC